MSGLGTYNYADEVMERARFFQTVHAWPIADVFNYTGWMANFSAGEEQCLAAHILDFFTYYPATIVDKSLRTCIGSAGHYVSRKLTDWKHSNLRDRCYYSYIPGENPHSADSGHLFSRKLRDKGGIPEQFIIKYEDISKVLGPLKEPTALILVDDFVGTGNQCVKAWKNNTFPDIGITLEQFSKATGHIFVYATLVANKLGYDRILHGCNGLHLSAVYVLGEEYNLFNQDCTCWKKDAGLFKEGVSLILDKSSKVGIPSTDGQDVRDEKGFGKQGLALAFHHGAPDAIPAFFYWCQNGWTPLIQKRYER